MKFFDDNKVFIVNAFLVVLIVITTFVESINYKNLMICLSFACYFALASSMMNWLAVKIILYKISFLYNIDKIRKFIEPIKIFLIKDIFASKDFTEVKNKYKKILTKEDKKRIENSFESLNIVDVMKVFSKSEKVKNTIKQNIIMKIYEIEEAIKENIINVLKNGNVQKDAKSFFKDNVLPIIEDKIELSVLSHTQSTIYKMLKNILNWLVIWGACCGFILGIIFKFFELV